MGQFTVSESVPLRRDPDPNSPPVATLSPGDRISNIVKLGDWAKINATDSAGNPQTGWILSQFLKEIVGQTVQLHPEPLSEHFIRR
jgi:Bacterial SH3 domain